MVTITAEQIVAEPDAFIKQLEAGVEVVIVSNSESLARAIPTHAATGRPLYGSSSGKIVISSDFDAPLDDFAEYQ
ncbi:MAG TPA: hypothetical protein VGK19_11670 [Capsulimonadaceae bacterium]|jgi:antitoxin (DNA-binding transcriptional repressor) of toxin-antitoxin stability system